MISSLTSKCRTSSLIVAHFAHILAQISDGLALLFGTTRASAHELNLSCKDGATAKFSEPGRSWQVGVCGETAQGPSHGS